MARRTTAPHPGGYAHVWSLNPENSKWECDCLLSYPVPVDGICPNRVADLIADRADAERELAELRTLAIEAKNLLLSWYTDGCLDSRTHDHLLEPTFDMAARLVDLAFVKPSSGT